MLSVDRARLAALVEESTLDPLPRAKALCALCQKTTAVSGASLCVAGESKHLSSTVCSTDELSVGLEELQLGLAEGPLVDALQSSFPVLESDLSNVSHGRWPWFAPAAVNAGAAAVFVLPLCEDERPLGALSLYRTSIGDLAAAQYDDFRECADAAVELLTAHDADPGEEAGAWTVGDGTGFRLEIHQAVGVVMSSLDVDDEHALARLRGYAFAQGRQIGEVAHDIVSGQLRLERDGA